MRQSRRERPEPRHSEGANKAVRPARDNENNDSTAGIPAKIKAKPRKGKRAGKTFNKSIMQAVARQSIMLTFNPASLSIRAQEALRQLRATKEFCVANVVEESPYDPAYVAKIQKAMEEPHTRVDNLADIWKL